MVKAFIQKHQPQEHWHVSEYYYPKDSYLSLSQIIEVQAANFFNQLLPLAHGKPTEWRNRWFQKHLNKGGWHKKYLSNLDYSDFKVFEAIVEQLPVNGILHCANSASIRYAQLFDHEPNLEHYANRGTSGIDGSTATAIGHALQSSKTVTLVTGDIAFLYDSAAFWNDRLPDNLKVIVLNNEGGNIFRIIKGPANIDHFERFQETHHQHNLELQCMRFCLDHIR
jgi:2-succinyl-5-enolpyruvyl-6-hydroxy-3-cyclohexene-1-carboxylate synthase